MGRYANTAASDTGQTAGDTGQAAGDTGQTASDTGQTAGDTGFYLSAFESRDSTWECIQIQCIILCKKKSGRPD